MESELPSTPEVTPEQTPEPIPAPTSVIAPITAVTATPGAAGPVVAEAVAYSDRSTGLTIFGIGQIILGLLAALMVPLMALGALMSRLTPGGAMRPSQMISGVATYVLLAAALITLGIGSIQAKRWAHALTLVASWYWLIAGVMITALITAVLPVAMRSAMRMQENASSAPSPEISAGVMAVILTLMIVFMAFFLVMLPIAFVVFYGRADVAETCRRRDPVERWTDRAPLPVLGASLIFFVGGLYMLLLGITTPLFPFFGKYLTGFAAGACLVLVAAFDLCVGVGLFRLKPLAWWAAIIAIPLRILSTAFTIGKADLMQAYSKMGWSDAQLRMLDSNPVIRSHVALWWGLGSMVVLLGYTVWLKRYFKAPESTQVDALPAQTS